MFLICTIRTLRKVHGEKETKTFTKDNPRLLWYSENDFQKKVKQFLKNRLSPIFLLSIQVREANKTFGSIWIYLRKLEQVPVFWVCAWSWRCNRLQFVKSCWKKCDILRLPFSKLYKLYYQKRHQIFSTHCNQLVHTITFSIIWENSRSAAVSQNQLKTQGFEYERLLINRHL